MAPDHVADHFNGSIRVNLLHTQHSQLSLALTLQFFDRRSSTFASSGSSTYG